MRPGPLTFTPVDTPNGERFRIEGQASVGKMLVTEPPEVPPTPGVSKSASPAGHVRFFTNDFASRTVLRWASFSATRRTCAVPEPQMDGRGGCPPNHSLCCYEPDVSETAKKLYDEALKLDDEELSVFALRMLDSVGEAPEVIEKARLEEVRAR